MAAVRINPGVKHLVRAAAEKVSTHPLVTFVDVDMPPERDRDPREPPSWIPQVHQDVADLVAERGTRLPFDLVVFTNLPHQYGEPGEPDPARHFYAMWAPWSRVPEAFVDLLGQAVGQYGNVPNDFPQPR